MKKITILFFMFSFLFAQSTIVYPTSTVGRQVTHSAATDRAYRIESGDVLEISIFGEEELSRTLMVMRNGTISFPLIGEVKVAGLTTDNVIVLLADKLEKYFAHPVVSIILKSPTLPYISVLGEILRQGAVEYQRGLRITDYIALAGGPSQKANLGKVKVLRFKKGRTVVAIINVEIKDSRSQSLSLNQEIGCMFRKDSPSTGEQFFSFLRSSSQPSISISPSIA